jgi:hypothetical protein
MCLNVRALLLQYLMKAKYLMIHLTFHKAGHVFSKHRQEMCDANLLTRARTSKQYFFCCS